MGDFVFEDAAVGDIARLGAALTAPIEHNGVKVLALPQGYCTAVIDTEKHQAAPNRKRGIVTTRDLRSFCLYVINHRTNGTLVLADKEQSKRVVAYLNHHEPDVAAIIAGSQSAEGTPGWADHLCVFEPRWTVGFTAWSGFADKRMTQEAFAEFLEDRIGEIAEPDGASLFEVVTKLRMTVETTYEKVLNLSNDAIQLVYQENVNTSLELPTRFKIAVRPYEGGDAVEITARLKVFKPDKDGKVYFQFRLGEEIRRLLDAAFDQMAEDITAATGCGVLLGEWKG